MFVLLIILGSLTGIFAQRTSQSDNPYDFETIYEVPATPVKNQYRSGTCWTFASASFLESELLRTGKGEFDLSEMFFVRNAYHDHAIEYVRFHGNLNFSSGAEGWDVMDVIKNYGLVTEEAYPGIEYGESNHVHGEMDNLLLSYVKGVIENKNKKLSPVWIKGFDGILDAYLGDYPNSFEYDKKKYSPSEFRDFLEINPDNYVALTSFTHHPYYSQFIFESPDNWSYGTIYNIPFNDLVTVIDEALEKGFSVAWAADVSEKGFSHLKGLALIPDMTTNETEGMERDKWEKLSKKEKDNFLLSFDHYVREMEITPELRQEAYDNYETTDDHLMHIIGLAKDNKGNKFYKVKNSWGTEGSRFEGYFYASENYVKYKTMSLMINKESLNKKLRSELKIK